MNLLCIILGSEYLSLPCRPGSDANDCDAGLLEGGDHFVGGSGVGDKHVQLFGLADAPSRDDVNLAVVDDGDAAARELDHGRVQVGFVGPKAACAPSGVDAVGSDEEGLDEHLLHALDGGGAYEGEPVAPEMAASDEDINVLAFGELHGDIDGVGDDGDVVIERKATDDFERGGAGGQSDTLTFLNEGGGSAADAALFVGELPEVSLEGAVVLEGLVEEGFDGDGAAMGALEQAILLELVEIAADGDDRSSELGAESFDSDGAGAAEFVEDGCQPDLLLAGYVCRRQVAAGPDTCRPIRSFHDCRLHLL